MLTIHKKTNFKLYIYLVIVFSIMLSTRLLLDSKIVITIIFFIVALAALYLYSYRTIPSIIMALLIITTIFKILYTYFLYSTGNTVFLDSGGYIIWAKKLQDINLFSSKEITNFVGTAHIMYYALIGFLYKLFSNVYALYLFNILIFNISIILLYRILYKDFSKGISIYTCAILVISMNTFIFTSHILKDSLVFFLTIFSVYIYKYKMDQFSRRTLLDVTILSLLLLALFMTRIYAGGAILLAILVDLVFIKKVKYKIILILSFSLFITISLISDYSGIYVKLISNFLSTIQLLSELPIFLMSIIKFFFAPLPWNFFNEDFSIYTLLIIDSSMIWVFSLTLIPFISRLLKDNVFCKKMVFYLTPLIVYAVALGIAYAGDSSRQRIGIYWVIILIFVNGLFYMLNKKSPYK